MQAGDQRHADFVSEPLLAQLGKDGLEHLQAERLAGQQLTMLAFCTVGLLNHATASRTSPRCKQPFKSVE